MAPRRGGGYYSSGRSGTVCPGAFDDPLDQASLALNVIMVVIYMVLLITSCLYRKRVGEGNTLIGIPFKLALFFSFLTYALILVASILQECDEITIYGYFDFQIPIAIFSGLNEWLLLVVVVHTLNTMLRKQLDHHGAVFKIIPLAIIVIMGALTAGLIGLQSYNYYSAYRTRSTESEAQQSLRVAYYVLYLVSVLASGALSLTTISQLRSRQFKAGDLLGWVIALIVAMAIWVIISLAIIAVILATYWIDLDASIALSYIINLVSALCFVFIICIAKHVAWRQPMQGDTNSGQAYAPVAQYQQQYAYNAPTSGQVYQHNVPTNGHVHYQQAPANGQVYHQQAPNQNDAPELVTGRH